MVMAGEADRVVLTRPFVQGATLTFSAPLRELALPFPTDLPDFIHNRWLAVMIAAVSRLGATPNRLVGYRQHADQQIGAGDVERLATADALRNRFRPHDETIERDLWAMLAIRARLDQRPEFVVKAAFGALLNSRIRHLQARTELPHGRIARMKTVAGELTSGRHHRHSRGTLSGLKDLLR
jgi:hypothetical protein